MLDFTTDKRATILRAALMVFTTYGFRKTSMDDIARQAGMSRPALYQNFKNKTDIFRALSQHMLDNAAENAKAALQSQKPFADRLFDAMDHSILATHRFIDSTQHGKELIGINEEIAIDIEEHWCDKMTDVIAQGFEKAHAAGEISLNNLSARQTARIFMQSMEGIKRDYLRGSPVEPDVQALVQFFSTSLEKKDNS